MPLFFFIIFCILPAMEEATPTPPPARKKIRLTRSEVYAMGISTPRKKRITFALVGLLVAVALGNVLWHFQDFWLSYWLPEQEPGPPAAAPAGETPPAPGPAAAAAPAAALDHELDFLSAALWDHPRFLQGVKMFNQALDQYRLFQRNRTDFTPLMRAEDGALQAEQVFATLQADAPAAVPLGDYAARCRTLVAEVRRAGSAAPAAAAPAEVPDLDPEVLRRDSDFVAGAALFNQALEKFKLYQADRSRKDLLPPTENLARQAALTFEALKKRVPANVHRELDRQIHQCYGLVSACRGQQLQNSGGAPEAGGFDRGTAGPARRPALPAYQPPQ